MIVVRPGSRVGRGPRAGRAGVGVAIAIALAACAAPAPPAARDRPFASAPTPAPTAVAAPAPLRRITNEQYDHAVLDLLGDASRPAQAFAPDELAGGFEANAVAPVTELQVERYVAAAEAVATAAVDRRLDAIAPCAATEAREACARRFVERFGRLAFRRRLDAAERDALVGLYAVTADGGGHARGVRVVLAAMLSSPRFLYLVEPAAPGGAARALSGEELATRLAAFLWASVPDEALLDDAEAGRLRAAEDVARVARRMLADPRSDRGARSFFRQWLGLRELGTRSKDAALYPAYSPDLERSMLEETLRFGADAVRRGGDVVATLLASPRSFVDARLAALYGVPAPPGGAFAPVDLPRAERAGLLTQASVLAVLAGAEQSSPILRGKLVRERLLCQPIEPPPPGVAVSPPRHDPRLSTKERFLEHRTDPSCTRCHELMDPLGFAFEHYDAVGAWRAHVGAFPVDAKGELTGAGDADGPFDGAVELAARLARSTTVRRCFATQWLRAALGRADAPEDAPSLEAALRAFSASGFDARELVVAIAASDAFRSTRAHEGRAP